MSFTFGTAVLFMILVTLGCFLLGLIFFGRLKSIRTIFWIIGGLLLLLTVSMPISHKWKMKKYGNKYTGKFSIDIRGSTCNLDTLTKYADLTLIVEDDQTFHLSRQSTLFDSISGEWHYEDDGDIAWMEYSFETESESNQNEWPSKNEWMLRGNECTVVFKRK